MTEKIIDQIVEQAQQETPVSIETREQLRNSGSELSRVIRAILTITHYLSSQPSQKTTDHISLYGLHEKIRRDIFPGELFSLKKQQNAIDLSAVISRVFEGDSTANIIGNKCYVKVSHMERFQLSFYSVLDTFLEQLIDLEDERREEVQATCILPTKPN